MTTKEIKIETSHVRALVDKSTYNKETRTFDVIFATETPVNAFQWELGDYKEILSCDTKNVRKERESVPLFDSHYPRNAMSQLGVCENIRFEKSQGVATVRLGARADEALEADIESGVISGISAGYRVYGYKQEGEIKVGSNEKPTYRAIDWEVTEISLAPVQADPKSKIRSQGTDDLHTVIINNLKSNQMAEETVIVDATREQKPDTNPPAIVVDVAKIREEATKDVKARIDAILISTRAAKLSDTEAIDYINSVDSIEKIRQSILEKFVALQPANPKADHSITIGKEAIEKKRELVEGAILNRIDSKVFPLTEGSREYRGMRVDQIARVMLEESGTRTQMMDNEAVAKLVFSGQRDMSTGDFPLLLENVMNKSLRGDYSYAPEFWDLIAKQTSVNDFKVKSMYQIESKNGMKQMADGEEINYGSLTEAKQTIKVESFGEGLKFTRRMFINDDLSAFSQIPSKFVLDWNTKRGDLVWGMLTTATDGALMDDGKKLFHAGHGNLLSGAGSALADAGLIAALKAFKAQTGIDGVRKIRVNPKYLIVSPDLEIAARKLLYVGVNPTQPSEVNVWAGAYTLIVEPRLSGNIWYLAADPSAIDGLYYAYLNGNAGLRSNREDNFKTDSIDFAVRGEFGVAAIDYRGWQKNVGA